MIRFAFKIAAKTGSAWSELIARESGSIYSHVECVVGGTLNEAVCFSSREPEGAGFKTIDLTTGEWAVFPLNCTPDQERMIDGYCYGANGKWYDGIGLIGYKLADPAIRDPHAVFCSEVCADICAKCAGKTLPKPAWLISPGELCELVKADFK